jgi:exodeoxyribonuclease III
MAHWSWLQAWGPDLKIVTWNVNSVRQRLPHVLDFLKEVSPDVLGLQEIKCQDDAFPRAEIEELGYNVATHGQKTFNGVALITKTSAEVMRGLPGDPQDEHARFIEGVISTPKGVVRVANVYFPNGNPAPGEKYAYKLAFMDRIIAHARQRLALEEPFVLMGDYNVIPEPIDAAKPELWLQDALFLPATRAKYRELLALGLTESVRAIDDAAGVYTFWDYQAGAWQRNNGIRIDHLLLSPQAADLLTSTFIHKDRRGAEKASDHVPVEVNLATA